MLTPVQSKMHVRLLTPPKLSCLVPQDPCGMGSRTPPWIPKSTGAQVPHMKWFRSTHSVGPPHPRIENGKGVYWKKKKKTHRHVDPWSLKPLLLKGQPHIATTEAESKVLCVHAALEVFRCRLKTTALTKVDFLLESLKTLEKVSLLPERYCDLSGKLSHCVRGRRPEL